MGGLCESRDLPSVIGIFERKASGRLLGFLNCSRALVDLKSWAGDWLLHGRPVRHPPYISDAATAALRPGGERGHQVEVHAGDVALLPTGTGHCELRASSEFLVVGAYPAGQEWDICRSAPSPQAIESMRNLPFPNSDPVYGPGGPMTRIWDWK
ncbi:MAG: hypothetical protein ACJ74Z_23490 [Bryobacteraceae bacterium]